MKLAALPAPLGIDTIAGVNFSYSVPAFFFLKMSSRAIASVSPSVMYRFLPPVAMACCHPKN